MYSAHERGCGRQIEKETGKERERGRKNDKVESKFELD